jgi:hypothetical protein
VGDFVVNTKHQDRFHRFGKALDFYGSVSRLKVSLHWQEYSAVMRPPNPVPR